MTTEKDLKRHDRNALEAALVEAGATIHGKTIRCPFHDDKHPSGGIYEKDGVWRFKCQTSSCGFCGDVFDVIERSGGKRVEDQLRDMNTDRPAPVKPARIFPTLEDIRSAVNAYSRVENIHVYTNPKTKTPDLVVVRSRDPEGKKNFTQYKPTIGGFCLGAPMKPWPIYNRSRVAAADAVIVVEGEKSVEALAGVGVVATTSPCGAGKAESADWQPLAGKTVYLWPDNDDPDPKTGKITGIEHMRQVATMLEQVRPAPRLYWLEPSILGLPVKGDAADFVADLEPDSDRGEEVWNVVKTISQPLGASGEVGKLIEDTISGVWRSIDWPWQSLSNLSKALFPGTMTLICGDPAAAKSFMVLDAMRHWHESGIPVALYELEDSRRDHMLRSLAQMSGRSEIKDDVWVRDNASEARAIVSAHQARLDSFGACITSPGEKHPTIDDLLKWLEVKCADGCKIIAIDPITYAEFSERPWQDDKRFIWGAQRIIRNSGARLIVVTHPRKSSAGGKSAGGLDDMAGGAAYGRHAQTVIWMKRVDPVEEFDFTSIHGPFKTDADRLAIISKARNGKGTGATIGFNFEPTSLRFTEIGLVVKQPAKKRQQSPRTAPIQDPFI